MPYYDWNNNLSNDPLWGILETPVITDILTGIEITHVLNCDTESGVIERLLLDKDGKPYFDKARREAAKIRECRQFSISFPHRQPAQHFHTPFGHHGAPSQQTWRDRPPLL